MTRHSRRQPTVLAVAPSTHGFGYVLFEGPLMLTDWGMRHVSKDKNKVSAAKVDELIARYRPDILVIEDYAGEGSCRQRRIRRLIRTILHRARKQGLETHQFSRGRIRKCFAPFSAKTKFEIAHRLAIGFRELELSLPRAKPKPWESPSPKMAVFDAAALAVVYFNDADPDSFPGADTSP